MDVPQPDESGLEQNLDAPGSTTTSRCGRMATSGNRLHPVWSRFLAVYWVAMTLGISSVAISSDLIGRPLWWVDDQRWSMPVIYVLATLFVGPTVVLAFSAAVRVRWLHWPSFGIALELIALALIDRDRSPGSSVVLGALGVAAMLAAIASMGARLPRVD